MAWTRWVIAAVQCVGATGACGRVVYEDFLDPTGTFAAYDPAFSYHFGSAHDYPLGDSHALYNGILVLTPDRVRITFNLEEGERITAARLLIHDFSSVGDTMVTFEGAEGSFQLPNFLVGTGETMIMPAHEVIGDLWSITVSGNNTFVRWIRVETEYVVTPAPGAGLVVVLGCALSRRRRGG